MMTLATGAALAQDSAPKAKPPKEKAPKAKIAEPYEEPPTPTPSPMPSPKLPGVFVRPVPSVRPYEQTPKGPIEPFKMKITRGTRIAVTSKAVNVTITGIDGDTLQATASSEAGTEPVKAEVSGESERPRVMLYVPATTPRRSRAVSLEIKVPRFAEIDAVESTTGDIDVTDIEGPVAISNGSGTVTVKRTGALKVNTRSGEITATTVKGDLTARTQHGNIEVKDVTGAMDVVATNGNVEAHNVGGEVRANLAVGNVELYCAKGRVEANTASGSITLVGIGGDVEATTASGEIMFKGPIRASGRYRLKSISGEVEMAIQSSPPGFTAMLSTYSGEIETAFPLKVEKPLQGGPLNRRINGRFGDGGAQITLDSFNSGVKLAKGTPADWKECK
jgi:hypothetical protein